MDTEKQPTEAEAAFYYSCLYNSLVLFAASPAYLEQLDMPYFNAPSEMESEFIYAFDNPVFDGVFKSGKVVELLREELLAFKKTVDSMPNELWQWEEILSNDKWNSVRQAAEKLLLQLGESRREYDFSFTNYSWIRTGC